MTLLNRTSIDPLVFKALLASDLKDVMGGKGTGTHVRASEATYVDPDDDLVKSAATNIPRFESVGSKRAILLEPAGTNIVQYSHELGSVASSAWWADTRLTSVTANGMLAPDGNTVADGLVGDVNDNTHSIDSSLIAAITQNDKVSITVFGKIGNKNWVQISANFYDAASGYLGDNGSYYFNISTGAIGTKIEVGDTTVHDYMIEEVANGFYRIGIIISNANAATAKIAPIIRSAHADNDNTFPGDTTTVNTWFWGADLKKQAFFDSYVPTSGATATRATESGYPLWTLPAGLFDAMGMASVWVRFGYDWDDMSDPTNSGILTGFNGPESIAYIRRTGAAAYIASHDGANIVFSAISFSAATWYKFVIKWGYDVGGNEKFRTGVDTGAGITWGTEVNFDGSYTLTANLGLAYGLFGPMWIRDLRLYDRILTDAEIDALGSP